MDTATILFTMPMKNGDPTQYTYIWAKKAVQMARNLGYKIVTLEKDRATYQNVNYALEKYNPRVVVHYGHGCRTNLQGQDSCMITRDYDIDELLSMAESPYIEERQKLLRMLDFETHPLGQLSCPGICGIEDPCADRCRENTNLGLLKNKIVFTTACFSADQLGKCAVKYGVDSYLGYDDLFLFPVDRIGSQEIFGRLQLVGLKELLLGGSVADIEYLLREEEDKLIRKFKPVKYMALSLLWNKIHRKVLGNLDATVY